MKRVHQLTIALLCVPCVAVGAQMLTGPALGEDRITQTDVTSGRLTDQEIRRKGLEIFSTQFNALDGYGDGTLRDRPTANGTWLRVGGLDAQSCFECHMVITNATLPATLGIGGLGSISASAMPGITEFDLDDRDDNGVAEINGRLINPPFLFGAGGVELLGNDMTADLQALRAQAMAAPGTVVELVTKGVTFGSISYAGGRFDNSDVEGVDKDLVVRPFGRKGDFKSIRDFDRYAFPFHMGMQTVEAVGQDVDADGDGVVNEVLIGELSALDIFIANLDRPRQLGSRRSDVKRGEQIFTEVGCASCHVPSLETNTTKLGLAFPEVETDPSANVFYTVDLRKGPAAFESNSSGGLIVPLFSDLKRHNMGPGLAEMTGEHEDRFFITARLWGIADSGPYLHDGRALTIEDAIVQHGGEGRPAAALFRALSDRDKGMLMAFLGSLRTPSDPAADISEPVRVR